MWRVYIALCGDGTLYTGVTTDIKRRLQQHKRGEGGHYTVSHRVISIVYEEIFNTQSEALKRESEIKGWRRSKKLNLINQ